MLKLLLLFTLTVGLMGCSSRSTPAKLPPSATLEVYTTADAKSPSTTEAIDPLTDKPLFLQNPPIVTAADVATVARSEIEVEMVDGSPSQSTQIALNVELTSAGAKKMAAATATPMGNPIAVVIDGQVVATPRLHSQINGSFQISGGGARFTSALEALTKP